MLKLINKINLKFINYCRERLSRFSNKVFNYKSAIYYKIIIKYQ